MKEYRLQPATPEQLKVCPDCLWSLTLNGCLLSGGVFRDEAAAVAYLREHKAPCVYRGIKGQMNPQKIVLHNQPVFRYLACDVGKDQKCIPSFVDKLENVDMQDADSGNSIVVDLWSGLWYFRGQWKPVDSIPAHPVSETGCAAPN